MGAASSQVSSDPSIIALAVDAFRIKMLAQTPETGQPAESHHIDAYVQPIRKALEEVWQADLQQADRGEAAGAYRRILGRVPERIPKEARMQRAQYSYRSGRYDRDSEIWSPDNAIHSIADLDLQDTDLEPVLVACYLSKGFIRHILHQLRDLPPPRGAWPTNMWYNEAMRFVDSEWSLWTSIDRAKKCSCENTTRYKVGSSFMQLLQETVLQQPRDREPPPPLNNPARARTEFYFGGIQHLYDAFLHNEARRAEVSQRSLPHQRAGTRHFSLRQMVIYR